MSVADDRVARISQATQGGDCESAPNVVTGNPERIPTIATA